MSHGQRQPFIIATTQSTYKHKSTTTCQKINYSCNDFVQPTNKTFELGRVCVHTWPNKHAKEGSLMNPIQLY